MFGIALFLAGIAGMYFFKNDLIDFIAGILAGSAFVFILSRRIAIKRAKSLIPNRQ